MAGGQQSSTVSLNARAGALAMLVSAPLNLVLHLHGQTLAPLSYLSWLGLTFGILCFCEEMGSGKPLNRGGLVLFAAAFWANTTATFAADPAEIARAQVLYAFSTLGALVLWSVALMHRREAARAMGQIGAAVGSGALVLLVAAHLLLGASTIMGFSQLFSAFDQAGQGSLGNLVVIDAVLFAWCLAISLLLWTARIRASETGTHALSQK